MEYPTTSQINNIRLIEQDTGYYSIFFNKDTKTIFSVDCETGQAMKFAQVGWSYCTEEEVAELRVVFKNINPKKP